MASIACEVRRLNTCSFDQALQAWNEGFQGYFVDMSASLDKFVERLNSQSLSVEHSFLAFCENQPAGILLNGIRNHAGRRVAWNGGTGVSPNFRRHGVGKALMRATLDFYKQASVKAATLEAISTNDRAIALYKQFGYEIIDRLIFLEHDGPIRPFITGSDDQFSIKHVVPAQAAQLDCYDAEAPWQTHWQSIKAINGQALIVQDRSGAELVYAFYKRHLNDNGEVSGIALYQCVARPGVPDALIRRALQHLYGPPELACRRSTYNFQASNKLVLDVLNEIGLKQFIEQVHMKIILE